MNSVTKKQTKTKSNKNPAPTLTRKMKDYCSRIEDDVNTLWSIHAEIEQSLDLPNKQGMWKILDAKNGGPIKLKDIANGVVISVNPQLKGTEGYVYFSEKSFFLNDAWFNEAADVISIVAIYHTTVVRLVHLFRAAASLERAALDCKQSVISAVSN